MTRWSIITARNILHSRTIVDAKERMDKSIVGSLAHFFQYLFDEKNFNASLCGRYNYKNITRWEKKAPGNNMSSLGVRAYP